MQEVGIVIKRDDIDQDLAAYLNGISPEKPLNFSTIREQIEAGSGRFTETEEILLLLESLVKRYKGEPGW